MVKVTVESPYLFKYLEYFREAAISADTIYLLDWYTGCVICIVEW